MVDVVGIGGRQNNLETYEIKAIGYYGEGSLPGGRRLHSRQKPQVVEACRSRGKQLVWALAKVIQTPIRHNEDCNRYQLNNDSDLVKLHT